MKEVYILSAVRTPIGKFGGALAALSATQLGAKAIEAAVDKAGIDKALIDEVIMGHVLQANVGQAPARQAAIYAGLDPKTRCTTVNKVCASGMKSITMGVQSILMGDAKVVVAGGMESMSNVPYYLDSMRWGNKYGEQRILDGIQKDALTDVYDGHAMGIAAEHCASECQISREQQDSYAMDSYKKAQAAWQTGAFSDEVIPVVISGKKGEKVIDQDEEPWSVDFAKIPLLKSAFMTDGTITAANASTMNDGAAAVVLIEKEYADSIGVKPIASVIGYADAEQEPIWFTTTPAIALPQALKKAGLTLQDMDYFEINEAFSVVAIENGRRLNIPMDRLNIHGGAVSLGHPLGCSGARIVTTLIHILRQKKGLYGAAGICNGGGGASALILKNH